MKEKGIGRPSTYAKIVQVLFLRKYVFERKGKVFCTALGAKVYHFLSKNYGEMVSEELTRKLEEEMDA
jgi:reverse gyrase